VAKGSQVVSKSVMSEQRYRLRSSIPKGYNRGDFSFVVEDEFRLKLEQAWTSFRRPVISAMIESSYTCGQVLHEFMNGLDHPGYHSGGSAVTFFQVCKLANDKWTEFLEWCVLDHSLYLTFGEETRANAKCALFNLTDR